MSSQIRGTNRTYDKFVQKFTVAFNQLQADNPGLLKVSLPKPLTGVPTNKALVAEICKVEYVEPLLNFPSSGNVVTRVVLLKTGRSPGGNTVRELMVDPTCFLIDVDEWFGNAVGTSYYILWQYRLPKEKDFMVDNKGFLVAGDFWAFAQTIGYSTSTYNDARIDIYYRWVEVPLFEYMGMIESTQ